MQDLESYTVSRVGSWNSTVREFDELCCQTGVGLDFPSVRERGRQLANLLSDGLRVRL